MTATVIYDPVRTNGDGAVKSFSFPWRVFDDTDPVVNVVTNLTNSKALQTIVTDYTVIINVIGEGGSIEMVVAPTALEDILIERVLPRTQTVDLPEVGTVRESVLEGEYDRGKMVDQEQDETLSRAMVLDIASSVGVSVALPAPVAKKSLIWANDGLSIVNSTQNVNDISDDVATTNANVVLTNADVVSTNADVVLTNADVVLTNADVASLIPALTNKSGGGHILGDVCIVSTGTDNAVANTTTQGDQTVICVATATIADNALGNYRVKGVIKVNTKGAATRGNFVRTSTTVKQAEDAGSTIVDGVFGIFLESGTDELLDCLLMTPASTVSSVQDLAIDSNDVIQRIVRGRYNDGGSILEGAGYSVANTSTGVKTITYSTAYPTNRPVVIPNPIFDASGDENITAVHDTNLGNVVIYTRVGDADTVIDSGCSFIACGDVA